MPPKTETTPPPLQGPSSKEKKYDRQLRLWAASGQQALEEAHVLLVNPSTVHKDEKWVRHHRGTGVVGVEALKNLVLPGIGNYTIVDDGTVEEEDLGVNFFLEQDSLGKSRGEETCRLLQELNPDVNGSFISQSIESLLEEAGFLNSYSLILVIAPLSPGTLTQICSRAGSKKIPVFYIHCVGFYSAFSLQLPDKFPIVETHPDPTSTQELRLTNPWPELAIAAGYLENLENLTDYDHGHVPYVLILLHFLEKWKEGHDGKLPESYRDKSDFREMVRSGTRTDNGEGGEENFDEAVNAVLKYIKPSTLGNNVREMFELEECINLEKSSANFWIIAAAIKEFYEKHKSLPLPGSLPDMKAKSDDYIKLQTIYKSKARQDVGEVVEVVRRLEERLGRDKCFGKKMQIPDEEIEAFCKNAAHIKIIRGTAIPSHDAYLLNPVEQWSKKLISKLEDESSLLHIWLAFNVFDSILIDPGDSSETALAEPEEWRRLINARNISRLKGLSGVNSSKGVGVSEEACERAYTAAEEMQRSVGGELHNIAALAGGMVAQEAIKVVTRQYVPVDNTCIFDGVTSKSEVIKIGID